MVANSPDFRFEPSNADDSRMERGLSQAVMERRFSGDAEVKSAAPASVEPQADQDLNQSCGVDWRYIVANSSRF